jgi:hypothetical protein
MLATTFIALKLVLDFVQTLFNNHVLGPLSDFETRYVVDVEAY